MAPKKQSRSVGPGSASGRSSPGQETPRIRPVAAGDLHAVAEIDRLNTGVAKPDYWHDIFERYGQSPRPRFFLVAEGDDSILGFIIGEVRAWEFGSEPCGWVFAIGVRQDMRLHHIGTHLLDALDECLRQAGASKVRTMLRRDNHLLMSFFRSQGMMAGPFLQLEKDLDEPLRLAADDPSRRDRL